MTSYVLLIIIAIVGGVAVTLQGQFMGLMDQGIGTRDYTPNSGFSGNDSFVYEICDSGAPSLCDTATVSGRRSRMAENLWRRPCCMGSPL